MRCSSGSSKTAARSTCGLRDGRGAVCRASAWRSAIAFLEAPIGDDEFGAGGHASQFGDDERLLRSGGLLEPGLQFDQLFAPTTAAANLLMPIANATHGQVP